MAMQININDIDTRFWIINLIFNIFIVGAGDIASGISVGAFTLYFVLVVITYVIYTIAKSTDERAAGTRVMGRIVDSSGNVILWKLGVAIAVGFFVALALGAKQLFGFGIDFSIILPPASAGLVGSTLSFAYFVTGFMAPMNEEPAVRGALEPSLRKWIPIVGLGTILFVLGVSVAIILLNYAFFIGAILAILGGVIWAVPVLRENTKFSKVESVATAIIVMLLSAVIANIFFASLHVFAYSTSNGQPVTFNQLVQNLLVAFFFGLMLSIMCIIVFDSIISSLIAHSGVNGIIFGVLFHISIIIGFIMSLSLAIIILMISIGLSLRPREQPVVLSV